MSCLVVSLQLLSGGAAPAFLELLGAVPTLLSQPHQTTRQLVQTLDSRAIHHPSCACRSIPHSRTDDDFANCSAPTAESCPDCLNCAVVTLADCLNCAVVLLADCLNCVVVLLPDCLNCAVVTLADCLNLVSWNVPQKSRPPLTCDELSTPSEPLSLQCRQISV